MSKPTWGIVATVSEPAPLLAAFAAHYVSAGASLVHLFFDAPNPQAATLLARFPQVKITDATSDHYLTRWNAVRPANIQRRQRLNATGAYDDASVDWLLHADADEFIETDALADELAEQPDEVDSLRLGNSERVFMLGEVADSIFSGSARLPIIGRPAKIIRLIGPEAHLYTTSGLSGHAWGKSISRTGRELSIGIHAPKLRSEAVVIPANAMFCHFDGLTPFHFVLKLMRYAPMTLYAKSKATGRNRVMQLNFARECGFDLARLRDLHGLVSGIAPDRASRMQGNGLLRTIGKSPVKSARQFYTEAELDLSIPAFDRALAARSQEATQLHARWVDLGLEG